MTLPSDEYTISEDAFGPEAENAWADDESLVTDGRSLLRPAQVVEGRLVNLMKSLPVMVSQFERSARPRFR